MINNQLRCQMISNLKFVSALNLEYDEITLPLHGKVDGEDKSDGSSVTQANRSA